MPKVRPQDPSIRRSIRNVNAEEIFSKLNECIVLAFEIASSLEDEGQPIDAVEWQTVASFFKAVLDRAKGLAR